MLLFCERKSALKNEQGRGEREKGKEERTRGGKREKKKGRTTILVD